jgi:hypothetical protein
MDPRLRGDDAGIFCTDNAGICADDARLSGDDASLCEDNASSCADDAGFCSDDACFSANVTHCGISQQQTKKGRLSPPFVPLACAR